MRRNEVLKGFTGQSGHLHPPGWPGNKTAGQDVIYSRQAKKGQQAMTRYAGTGPQPYDRGDGTLVHSNGDDWPSRFVITGYDYTPASPNPDDCPESYRPVTLEWYLPNDEPFGVVTLHQATNGWRASRIYKITTPGATNTYGVMVNGVHIPVEFYSVHDAKLFAQHIEDTNTEN